MSLPFPVPPFLTCPPPRPPKQRQAILNIDLQSRLRKTKGDLNPRHLRLKVLPESFGKGVIVDFQLSDLEKGNSCLSLRLRDSRLCPLLSRCPSPSPCGPALTSAFW